MKSLFIIGLNIFVAIFLMAYNSENSKRLEQALLFAGENREMMWIEASKAVDINEHNI